MVIDDKQTSASASRRLICKIQKDVVVQGLRITGAWDADLLQRFDPDLHSTSFQVFLRHLYRERIAAELDKVLPSLLSHSDGHSHSLAFFLCAQHLNIEIPVRGFWDLVQKEKLVFPGKSGH